MSLWSKAAGALVIACLVPAATAVAQGTKPRFGVALSRTISTGDYHAAPSGEGFDAGWQGMALVQLKPAGWPVGVRVDIAYGVNNANDRLNNDLTASLGRPTEEKAKLLGANADATYAFPSSSRAHPYLLGGLGIYHVTIAVTSGGSTGGDSGTKLAWNLGGGIAYDVGRVALFLEGRYVGVAAVSGLPRATFLPITAGLRFGGP